MVRVNEIYKVGSFGEFEVQSIHTITEIVTMKSIYNIVIL